MSYPTADSKEIKEIDNVLDNLEWLKSQMPSAVKNWKVAIKDDCGFYRGYLKQQCEKPGLIIKNVFDPLIDWINSYKAIRMGTKKLLEPLDSFLTKGLYRIWRFTIVADNFLRHPEYFIPDVPVSNLKAYSKNVKKQQLYKDIIIQLNQRLIGCKKEFEFMFIKLADTIRQLSPDLQKKKSELEQACMTLRFEALKLKK